MKSNPPNPDSQGWLFYDGNCPLCVDAVRGFKPIFPRLGIQTESLHAPWVARRLGLSHDQLLAQGWMITPEGKLIGGADIWLYAAGKLWWGFPFRVLAAVPGGRWVIHRTYRWIATHRYRISRFLGLGDGGAIQPAMSRPFAIALRVCIAAIWFQQGLYYKLLAQAPHQLRVIESVLPEFADHASLVLCAIGLGETVLGVFVLSGLFPKFLAWFQASVLVAMNGAGILFGAGAIPDPIGMIAANLPFFLAILLSVKQPDGKPSGWCNTERNGRSTDKPEINFGQVHEDSMTELAMLCSLGPDASAFCIASGGCTALSLLLADPKRVDTIDVNPAQLHLVDLKKALFEYCTYPEMFAALSENAKPHYLRVRNQLDPQTRRFWDGHSRLLDEGLNRCGTVERNIQKVLPTLVRFIHPGRQLEHLLDQPKLDRQEEYYWMVWDNWAWKSIFALGLNPVLLRPFYGSLAAWLPSGFSRSVKTRVDEIFTRHPAFKNSEVWQTFRGTYPRTQEGLPPYLRSPAFEQIRSSIGKLHTHCADATTWLEAQSPQTYNFIALSNILDTIGPDQAANLLHAAWRAAKPGAVICLRSLFPHRLEALEINPGYADASISWVRDLRRNDRSLVCHHLRVLIVQKEARS